MGINQDVERRWGDIVLWGPFVPLEVGDLDEVEDSIGAELPPSYRSFLLVAHGGTIPYSIRLPRSPRR